jgi:hypothetical protein
VGYCSVAHTLVDLFGRLTLFLVHQALYASFTWAFEHRLGGIALVHKGLEVGHRINDIFGACSAIVHKLLNRSQLVGQFVLHA